MASALLAWFTRGMTEYTFHWWSVNGRSAPAPHLTLAAPSHLHGAALALRYFASLGCDISTPLAHVDMTEPDGTRQTLLVEEVVDWLQEPDQRGFVGDEGLAGLIG